MDVDSVHYVGWQLLHMKCHHTETFLALSATGLFILQLSADLLIVTDKNFQEGSI